MLPLLLPYFRRYNYNYYSPTYPALSQVPRFNERFILSMGAAGARCLALDDELNVLPLTSSALRARSSAADAGAASAEDAASAAKAVDPELAELIESLTEKASGKALPLTDDEKAAFQALHDAQIAKGKSKH